MINDLKYPLGFLLTKHNFKNNYDWEEYHLKDEWVLYYDKRNEFSHYELDTTKIIVLGYFLDIRDGLLDRRKIIDTLIYSRKISYDKFLDELSYLNGRFLLILKHEEKTLLFHDAAGLRAVCYHEDEPIIASHDTIINEVMNGQLPQIYSSPSEIAFSDYTRFSSVRKLIPNMTFDIDKRRIKRYYPHSNYEIKSKKEIRSQLILYLRETIKWFNNSNYKPLLSITGGGDSRLSLAILKPIIDEAETFTYLRDTENLSEFVKETYKNDERIVSSIVNNLNLNHNFFHISTKKNVDEEIVETIKHNVFSSHSFNLANDYYKLYSDEKYLHIRSTGIFNIGKYIFPKNTLKIEEWNEEQIAKFLSKWTKIKDEEENVDYIKRLIKHAQLDDFYNYNPLELLFISYRLIQWHSGVVGESDIAFNTMLLLNSRKIVDLLLSYPVEDRAANKLFIELIEEMWPILNYWSINSVETITDRYKKAVDEIQSQKEVNKLFLPKLIETKTTQSANLKCISYKHGHLYKFHKTVNINDYYLICINLSKLNTKMSLKFKLKFFINDEEKRGLVSVTSNLFDEEKDILDLYGEKEFVISSYDINRDIYLKVHHLSSDVSVEESKVWIGDFELFD